MKVIITPLKRAFFGEGPHRVSPAPMSRFRRICVYCASSDAIDDRYRDAAQQMGHALADRGIGLVFGGGRVGLMGTIADTMIDRGCEVIGVIPEKLQDRELGHPGCSELHVVTTMHERKQMMMDLSDGFIAMPGGYGTLEELFEAVTWAQLNYHRCPVGLLNTEGFFDALVAFVAHATGEGFIRKEQGGLMQCAADPTALLDQLEQAEIPDIASWLPDLSDR